VLDPVFCWAKIKKAKKEKEIKAGKEDVQVGGVGLGENENEDCPPTSQNLATQCYAVRRCAKIPGRHPCAPFPPKQNKERKQK
jgi:hypothetical protein